MKSAVAVPTFAYVGCFTTEKRKARGKGISGYRIDPQSGAWHLVQVCATPDNPGFLALGRDDRFLYAAHGSSREISAYSIDAPTGKLTLLNTQPSGGNNAPHLTVDPAGRYVLLANGPGIAVFPINKDGSLAPASDLVVPPGEPGPYRDEQNGPHPHQVIFDPTGRFIIAPDKGLDKVLVYKLDLASGKLVANDPAFVKARYGAVPRHVVIHPTAPYAYVVNELGSAVAVYHWDANRGELKPLQLVPTTPTTHTSKNTGAEIAIAPSGNFIYASNRGHDSIVTFAVDQKTGMLEPTGWESSRGKRPRFFALDAGGTRLYVANQDSDTIVAFSVEPETGKLTYTGLVAETGTPTCIVFTCR